MNIIIHFTIFDLTQTNPMYNITYTLFGQNFFHRTTKQLVMITTKKLQGEKSHEKWIQSARGSTG